MEKTNDIKDTLFAYVTDKARWFYWYHSPERLKALYMKDHAEDEKYKEINGFTKRVWRFKGKPVGESVIEENLADFFNDAVLDEVRLKKANAFAKYALYISDNDDLAYFRDTATKRETSADIDYDRQRDHAVHTFYNYLLGWYIFEHSVELQRAFRDHFGAEDKLNIGLDEQNEKLFHFYKDEFPTICKEYGVQINADPEDWSLIGLVHEFADVWPIASLLHDIGYILEGSLSSASPEVEHLRVANGSKIIHDYFNHYFWKSFEVDFRVANNIAKTLGVVIPDFKNSRSLASLGDHLCDIGSCENIRKDILNQSTTTYDSIKSISEEYGLNREAFSIWEEHYKCHSSQKMANILYVVERVYRDMMWVGDGHGKRNLDHGVCSGLITLQALTFFHELFWGFCQTQWLSVPPDKKNDFSKKQNNLLNDTSNRVSEELFGHIDKEITRVPIRIRVRGEFETKKYTNHDDKSCKLRSYFWFKKILWATASSAIHSIIQKEEYRNECQKHINAKLRINYKDDPLAFLGVFVDVLQEWDRYKVAGRGEAAFSDTKLLQSTEVYLYWSKEELKELKRSCEISCDKKSCAEAIDKNEVDSIYLMYPGGNDKEKKDWINALTTTMKNGLEDDWDTIVKIVACDKYRVK